MQRLRQSLILQLVKQAHLVPAVSPLPGLRLFAAPALCTLTAALPAAKAGVNSCTSLISLRNFAAAAEPCRVEEQQSAAEALFKSPADDHTSVQYEAAVYPFFARAYYVGNSINLTQLTKQAHKMGYHTYVGKGMVLICAAADTKGKLSEDGCVTGLPLETYVAAYKYGSVVIFNGRDREKEVLKLCQEFCTEPTKQHYTEEFPIIVQPDHPAPNDLTPDRIILRQLEFNNIRTLSHVLGQSVALDRYAEVAERMLSNFMHMNSTMKRRGDFKDVKKHKLLSLVAENNMILTDIIAKLGLQERFDIAWKSNQHNEVYEHLREELEIEERFSIVQTKLELVQDNLKYFLEIMQNNKSVLLEWLIIALISAEIALGVFEIITRV